MRESVPQMTGQQGAVSPQDRAAISAQLEREPRGLHAVAHRCGCGLPDVVATQPRLPDGSPFPTFYYLTCPRMSRAMSRLESAGVMADFALELTTDDALADAYRAAHADYLSRRDELGVVEEIADYSAGGMPDRVKCLHSLVAHALVAGPGVNPIGDRALAAAAGDPDCSARTLPCVSMPDPTFS